MANIIKTTARTISGFCVKNAPTILTGAGIIAIVGGTVLACRATLKSSKILDEMQEDMNKIDMLIKKGDTEVDYTDEEKTQAKRILAVKSTAKVALQYAPAILTIGAGITCILVGHHILQKRVVGITAALAATTQSFNEYRARVKNTIGEEQELKIYRGESEEIEVVVDEAGNEITNTQKSYYPVSPYAVIFNDTNPNWNRDRHAVLAFLQAQKEYANHALKARGHLYLNEVRRWLGFKDVGEGGMVGWIDDPACGGDCTISFGIDDTKGVNFDDPMIRDFVTGEIDYLVLDFNVDGSIWDKI